MIGRGALYLRRHVESVGRVGLSLLALTAIEIALLVFLRVAAPHSSVELVLQVALAFTFAALAIVDLRVALAVAVLELVVGGASGRWTELPAGLTGRMMLDGVLGVVALVRLAQRTRAAGLAIGRRALGRYGLHVAAIAIIVPAIWMPLGLLNGNLPRDVLADGDGFFFFAFALVLAAAALYGDLAWLRRWLLVACVVNALFTLALAAVVVAGLIRPVELDALVVGTFDMGGLVNRSPGGALRVALASGLFLQVGVALVSWELVRSWRRWWPWVSMVALMAGLIVTYTRGYWLGAFIAGAMVFILGSAVFNRRPVLKGAVGIVLGSIIAVAVLAFVLLEVRGGVGSNPLKLHQAQILLGHIVERPLLGWGFGSIAADYPYGRTFSYEITYLDRAFKLGIVGLLLFLSFPLRLLIDGARVVAHRLPPPPRMTSEEAAVPLAILTSVLVASATNPYLAGSVGIGAVILAIAWLDPFSPSTT